MEDGENETTFFLLTFNKVFKSSTPEKIANIWRIEQDGISAIKFEVARPHLLINVFVVVAVVVA